MPKRVFWSLLLIYIALGASWESTGIAIFAGKVFLHMSFMQLNCLGIAQYLAVFIMSFFGYLFVRRLEPPRLLLIAIFLILIGFFAYVIFAKYYFLFAAYFLLGVALTLIKATLYIITQQYCEDSNALSKNLNYLEGAFFIGPIFTYWLTVWIVNHHPADWRFVYLFPLVLLCLAIFAIYNVKNELATLHTIEGKNTQVIKKYFSLLRKTPTKASLLLVVSFAIIGILNVWSPLIIFHYTQHVKASLLISSLTFFALIAGRWLSAWLMAFIRDTLLAKLLSILLLILVFICLLLNSATVVYLIPLFNLLAGPVIIIFSAKLVFQQDFSSRYLLCFWVLSLSSLGDLFGVRAIGYVLHALPIFWVYIVFAIFIALMVSLQFIKNNPSRLSPKT